METFDEWYKRKHGYTFDEEYMQPSMMISDAMKALSVELRKYVSEFVKDEKNETPTRKTD
jgi:hypothetical protein